MSSKAATVPPEHRPANAEKMQRLREIAPDYSAQMIEGFREISRIVFTDYYRCEWRGADRIPADTVLVVGNHNAGGVPDIVLMLHAWTERYAGSRPLLGLAHKINFKVPVFRTIVPGIGGVPACPEKAREVLGAGIDLAVFPGGDWDAARPSSEAGHIDFAGRKGFLHLALDTGVRISPLVIAGVHEGAVIFGRGTKIASLLGLNKRFRLKTLPVGIPFPVIPTRAIMETLDPIDLKQELKGIRGREKTLEAAYQLVISRMQEKMDELRSELSCD